MLLMANSLATAVICGLLITTVLVPAQSANTPSKPLQWDVISVKPMALDTCPGGRGGVGYLPDGLTASCVPLLFVVENAYRMMDGSRIAGLPEWAKGDSELYAIEARVSGEDVAAYSKLSRDEKFRMLQPVLAERFHMKAHMEARQMPAYALVIARSGPKLKEPAANEPSSSQFGETTGVIQWANSPLTNLMWLLSREVGKPVVDKTGLAGKYDFTLEYAPAARESTEDAGKPSVFTALEEQIGLRLVSSKEHVDVLVIDSIDRPAAN
jgi:uncharacterized protein (TIGR03435 family)